MTINWKSGGLGNAFRIFKGKQIVGLLKLDNWRTEGYGELNGYLVRFKTSGFVRPLTRILDIEGTRELGSIRYSYRTMSARIVLEEKEFQWKFEKWNGNNWFIEAEYGSIHFSQKGWWNGQGSITYDEDESKMLILSGLYIRSFLVRAIAG